MYWMKKLRFFFPRGFPRNFYRDFGTKNRNSHDALYVYHYSKVQKLIVNSGVNQKIPLLNIITHK